jgi:hypothetical protein
MSDGNSSGDDDGAGIIVIGGALLIQTVLGGWACVSGAVGMSLLAK